MDPELPGHELEHEPDDERDDDLDTVPWRAFLAEAERRLAEAGFPTADLDARRIVEQSAGAEPAELFFILDDPATVRGVAAFDRLLERRLRGEPLQYVVGVWGFRTLDLIVDRRVLIPRPETEIVTEWALAELDRRARELDGERTPVVADLGTGSGAIALSIAAERPDVAVWASDASPDALAVARANLVGLGQAAARVRLVEGSWLDALPAELRGTLDVVVSNPPYVADDDDLPAEVLDWEPRDALYAGPAGTEVLDHLVAAVPGWLVPGGALVVELAPAQAPVVAQAARAAGFVEVEVVQDLTGRDRGVVARTPVS